MSFPNSLTSVTNLSSSISRPSDAREDLLNFVENLNQVIDGVNTAGGVTTLTANAIVDTAYIPQKIATVGTLSFQPSDQVVIASNITRLSPLTLEQIHAIDNAELGDIVMCSAVTYDYPGYGNITLPVICAYTGTNWVFWSPVMNGQPV